MKKQTPLETFIEPVAYEYILDPDFQLVTDAAGINWFKLPQYGCVEAVLKYKSLRANAPHEACIHDEFIQSVLQFLRAKNINLQKHSREVLGLSDQFQKASQAQKAVELAAKLLKDPTSGRDAVMEFFSEVNKPVKMLESKDLFKTAYKAISAASKRGEVKRVIPGFEMLSEAISGFNSGRLNMILASTGFGKTNLALALAIAASKKYICAYYNMEMSNEDIGKRVIAGTSNTEYRYIDTLEVDMSRAKDHFDSMEGQLWISDGEALSIRQLEADIRLKKAKNSELKFVFIDYDQKIEFDYDPRDPEFRQMQRAMVFLDSFSREMDLNILMVAQVNRENQIASSHRAQFPAHAVLEFYDDTQYGPVIRPLKNRHGQKGDSVQIDYRPAQMLFIEKNRIIIKDEDKNKKSKEMM